MKTKFTLIRGGRYDVPSDAPKRPTPVQTPPRKLRSLFDVLDGEPKKPTTLLDVLDEVQCK